MAFDVAKWSNEITNDDSIISYIGHVSGTIIDEVLDKIEEKLEQDDVKKRISRKIYNVAVELLQNLYHHSENIEGQKGINSIFAFKKTGEGEYNILTGNFIKNENIRLLQNRIDQINYLTEEEVKVLYKLVLNNNVFSDKGGGGLGLIDIARKTGHKLGYDFHSVLGNFNYFVLNIVIS